MDHTDETGQPHPAILWPRSKINSGRFIAKRPTGRAPDRTTHSTRVIYDHRGAVAVSVQSCPKADQRWPVYSRQPRLITFPLSAGPLHRRYLTPGLYVILYDRYYNGSRRPCIGPTGKPPQNNAVQAGRRVTKKYAAHLHEPSSGHHAIQTTTTDNRLSASSATLSCNFCNVPPPPQLYHLYLNLCNNNNNNKWLIMTFQKLTVSCNQKTSHRKKKKLYMLF